MMKINAENIAPTCEKFEWAFEFLGKPWTGLIIRALLHGPKRAKEIAESIPNISGRVLNQRLKELEDIEVVKRTVYTERPVRIEYELTEMGKSLEPAMEEVQKWADMWWETMQKQDK